MALKIIQLTPPSFCLISLPHIIISYAPPKMKIEGIPQILLLLKILQREQLILLNISFWCLFTDYSTIIGKIASSVSEHRLRSLLTFAFLKQPSSLKKTIFPKTVLNILMDIPQQHIHRTSEEFILKT